MARTVVDAKLQDERLAQTSPAESNGTARRAAPTTRQRNAFKLTDPLGRQAYIWWEDHGAVVEAEAPALERRVLRALKKPIVSVEDEVDEFGVRWSTQVLIQPDDPRYPTRLFWSWIQVGLRDVKVEVVRRDSRKRVWPTWDNDGRTDRAPASPATAGEDRG
jgi:hypothetical protein